MFNMMKLDWLGMKSFHKRIWINLGFMVVVGFATQGAAVIPMSAFSMFEFASYSFDAEDKGKLHYLYLTLPVSRKTFIRARFGLAVGLTLIGAAAGVVLTLPISALLNSGIFPNEPFFKASFQNIILLICAGIYAPAFMCLFTYPTMLKLGYAKAKVIGWALPIGIMVALGIIAVSVYTRVEAFAEFVKRTVERAFESAGAVSLIILCASALFFALSYALSQKFYAKREF